MHASAGLLVAGLFLASPAWAGLEGHTVYVDCGVTPGGDGSAGAPYDTITGALPSAKAWAATHAVGISVTGTCQRETFPISLDFAVHLFGQRLPKYDRELLPIDGQYRDTVVTWPAPPVPMPSGLSFVLIKGDGVKVSRISLDGKVAPQGDVVAPAAPAPIGILVVAADDFAVEHVRVVGTGETLSINGSNGRVVGSYLRSSTGNGMFVGGGDPVAEVIVSNNRIVYRTNGFAAAGGTPATATIPAGLALELLVVHNDVLTTYTNTGPSNPAAIRLSPAVGAGAPGNPPDGTLIGWFFLNSVRGTPRWSLMIHGGFPRFRLDGPHSTGVVQAVFAGTSLDASAQASSDALITFTAARAIALPCELNPNIEPANCITPGGPQFWEYLEGGFYDLWHSGELDGALIDYRDTAPHDGHSLDNLLLMNDEEPEHQTFFDIPGIDVP